MATHEGGGWMLEVGSQWCCHCRDGALEVEVDEQDDGISIVEVAVVLRQSTRVNGDAGVRVRIDAERGDLWLWMASMARWRR